MPKERNFNPVQAQRKAEKAKAIKKGKAEVAAARNERLAKKNPERIQKQIDDLKAITESGGKLTQHEEHILEGLEKEVKAVKKARDALGENAPAFGYGSSGVGNSKDGRPYGRDHGDILGKRRRRNDESSSDSEVPEDVRSIPMPRDTPPPIPRRILDEWYSKQRARKDVNRMPLGEGTAGGRGGRIEDRAQDSEGPVSATAGRALPQNPIGSKTVYEAKPVLRDLQKEAISAFVPTVVRRKLEKGRGMGGIIEPEEADRLEKGGYLKSSNSAATGGGGNAQSSKMLQPQSPPLPDAMPGQSRHVTIEDVEDDGDEG